MLKRSDAALDAEDTFLPLVLGILSATRRFAAILDVLAPPVNGETPVESAGNVPVEIDERCPPPAAHPRVRPSQFAPSGREGRGAPQDPERPKVPVDDAGKVPVEDITLLLLLGIVSLSRQARASIEEAAPPRPDRTPAPAKTPTVPSGTLLR